jgi:hypothetical protein
VEEGDVESRPGGSDAGTGAEPIGADFIIPLLGSGLTIYYLGTTIELVWEARATATFIGGILLTMSVVQFFRLFRQLAAGTGSLSLGGLTDNTLHNRQRLALILLVALFIGTIEWVGTTLGLALLLVGCMLVLGVYRVRTLLAVSIITSAVVYVLLIYLLESRLPAGPVEHWIARMLAGGA